MAPLEIYNHYGYQQDNTKVASGEYPLVDFNVYREADIKEVTANMAGFGIEQSQMVIIEYDKGYGHFVVKRIPKKYGASGDAPPEN